MTVKRMDNVLIVVDDLEAVKAFFIELGLTLEGESTVEGPLVGKLIGLEDVRATLAMMRTPDGQGIELDKFHTPNAIRFGPVDAPVNTLGIRRVMFAVDDIDAVVDAPSPTRLSSEHPVDEKGHRGSNMKRVTGIGGVFFSAKDPVALRAWYKQHLGIDVQEWGGAAFTWTDAEGNPTKGTTAWYISPDDGKHFAPSKSTFMVNYRVEDLAALLQALRDEGCNVLEKTDDSELGKFGWVMDPEGNKIELWQPPPGE